MRTNYRSSLKQTLYMIFDGGELRLIYLVLEQSYICSEPFARYGVGPFTRQANKSNDSRLNITALVPP